MTNGWTPIAFEPVALIAWALIGSLIICYQRREWVSLWSVLVVLILHFSLASPLTANLLVASLENMSIDMSSCHLDSKSLPIVVLAGGVKVNSGGPDQVDALHLTSFRRAIAAARLAIKTPETILVVSGGSGRAVKEADLMSILITRLGVSPTRIIKESTSKNTHESAIRTRQIIESLGIDKIMLVTSAIHIPRATATFRKQNIEVCPKPIDHRWVKPILPGALIPQITALQKSTDALHEIYGVLWYRIKGWL